MNIKFKKIKVEKRLNSSFESWNSNNELEFGDKHFVTVYAPNGVGKSTLAKVLKNEIKSNYEYEYNGTTYTEKSKSIPIAVIDDFFFRNIAIRENEKLSDYILGSQIKKELELREKINITNEKIKTKIISYLKDTFNIKTKNSNLVECSKDDVFKNFISSVANNRNKGKDYNEKELLELLTKFKDKKNIEIDTSKYIYVRENLEKEESIIKSIISFNTKDIKAIQGFSKLDIDNDAIKILDKHRDIKKCIFEESHVLPDDMKEQLEENKRKIIEQLNEEQKKIVSKVLELTDIEPFGIKSIFTNAFELGEIDNINELVAEIKEIILYIENTIKDKVMQTITENGLKELNDEYVKLIDGKIELSDEDEMLLKEIIVNCINRNVKFERDNNKNIVFKLEDSELIGKTRQDLPLSTGEQNFISLYFELLSAKNRIEEIIIIDDPISSFDSVYKNKIIYAILKVLSKKRVIILTHNIDTIKLAHYQYKDCFNLYLLNNQNEGENGFIKINRKTSTSDIPKDLDLVLEIKNILDILINTTFINFVKEREQFLIALIPFMRSYTNLLKNKNTEYKELCKLMHGYENQKIDINEKYKNIFGIDLLNKNYNIDVNDILNITIKEEIVDKNEYPLLNRTLIHILTYLKLRLLVEQTLYNTDKNKLDINRNPQLHQIIETYLKDNPKIKTSFLSKKTLLNEFNHFDFDMCLFMPSLDISDSKLKEEENSVIDMCNKIKTNGL